MREMSDLDNTVNDPDKEPHIRIFDEDEDIPQFLLCKRRPDIIQACKINGIFRVKNKDGNYQVGIHGDFLLKDDKGHLSVCPQEVFVNTYEFVENGARSPEFNNNLPTTPTFYLQDIPDIVTYGAYQEHARKKCFQATIDETIEFIEKLPKYGRKPEGDDWNFTVMDDPEGRN